MDRMHITGCPRSGTTLMMELMRSCFENDGYCDHEMSIFESPTEQPDLFISKQPSDIRRIHYPLLADKHLFVINMVRDPRDVITSVHKNYPGMFFCNYRVWKESYSKAQQLHHCNRFLQVRYEELASTPDLVQEKIENYFPFLTRKQLFSEYHKFAHPSSKAQAAMGGVREISANRVNRWKEHLPRIKHEIQHHPDMCDHLIDLRYESDSAWLEVLQPVQAEKGRCRYPDQDNFFKKMELVIRNFLKIVRYIINSKKNKG